MPQGARASSRVPKATLELLEDCTAQVFPRVDQDLFENLSFLRFAYICCVFEVCIIRLLYDALVCCVKRTGFWCLFCRCGSDFIDSVNCAVSVPLLAVQLEMHCVHGAVSGPLFF